MTAEDQWSETTLPPRCTAVPPVLRGHLKEFPVQSNSFISSACCLSPALTAGTGAQLTQPNLQHREKSAASDPCYVSGMPRQGGSDTAFSFSATPGHLFHGLALAPQVQGEDKAGLFCHGPPASLALPMAVAMPAHPGPEEGTPCLFHQPQPPSCTTKSSSRPAAGGNTGDCPSSALPCPHWSCRMRVCGRFPPQQKGFEHSGIILLQG